MTTLAALNSQQAMQSRLAEGRIPALRPHAMLVARPAFILLAARAYLSAVPAAGCPERCSGHPQLVAGRGRLYVDVTAQDWYSG